MKTKEKRNDNRGEKLKRVNDDGIYVYKKRKRNIETTRRDINSHFMKNHTHKHTHKINIINNDHDILMCVI